MKGGTLYTLSLDGGPDRKPVEVFRSDLRMFGPKFSPDGRFLAYNATDSSGTSRIWLRPMASLTAEPLPGTEGAQRPFWSPDSQCIGFRAGGSLKRVSVSGGAVLTICKSVVE